MPLIFVYGSLKAGFQNFHLNKGVRQPGTFRTRERLPMFLLGDGHVPCLVLAPGSGHQVRGEVYDVDDEVLAAMDGLERLGEPRGYRRVTIDVEATGDGLAAALLTPFVYVKLPEHVDAGDKHDGPLVEYTTEYAAKFHW